MNKLRIFRVDRDKGEHSCCYGAAIVVDDEVSAWDHANNKRIFVKETRTVLECRDEGMESAEWICRALNSHARFCCKDCNREARCNDMDYMVWDSIWQEANGEDLKGCLCISCLEKRIDRKLQICDFPPVPVNDKRVQKMREVLK